MTSTEEAETKTTPEPCAEGTVAADAHVTPRPGANQVVEPREESSGERELRLKRDYYAALYEQARKEAGPGPVRIRKSAAAYIKHKIPPGSRATSPAWTWRDGVFLVGIAMFASTIFIMILMTNAGKLMSMIRRFS
ncbi:hypothetical protein FVE85_7150 [Porphyridium purpureum]|uniref:Uncharacterized protein n=1 Tax=Porphyridium purpureum TaxID=35688 RepID=A0A5J4Z8D2_PORPP|nr:hypothetical protein FVE85_7150 [Porphyridium purpureum]|eukprot:POR8513..scf295_1